MWDAVISYLALEPEVMLGNGSHDVVIGNDTIDIMLRGCFKRFDTIACIRNGIMSLMVAITGLLCLYKVIRLHLYRHRIIHQYVIFYSATLECAICAVHWILGKYAEMDFVMQYLKLIQFLAVCHFYWKLATIVVRKEYLTRRVLIPGVVTCLTYFTVVTTIGIVNVKNSWVECFEPYWLMLSAAEFAIVQLFAIAGVYITRRLNEISTLESVRMAQKRDLWSLIVFFELSALFGLVYDVTMKSLEDTDKGCSGVFKHMQEIYSPIFGTFMVMKFLVPIWVMLCVFHPIETAPDQEDLLPQISEEGTYTSVFSPTYENRRYKQLYSPSSGELPSPDFDSSPSDHTPPEQVTPIRRSSSLAPITEERPSIQTLG